MQGQMSLKTAVYIISSVAWGGGDDFENVMHVNLYRNIQATPIWTREEPGLAMSQ